jgi:molecular chaperone GrpE
MTPESIDALLARFRDWLTTQPDHAEPAPADLLEEPLDLASILREFVALRHEVNLHTKATRTLNEHAEQLLARLAASQPPAAPPDPPDPPADSTAAPPPYLQPLLEMHDALLLVGRESARVQAQLAAALANAQANAPASAATGDPPPPPADPQPPKLTWWMRQSGAAAIIAAQQQAITQLRLQLASSASYRAIIERAVRMLQASTAGFQLALARVERQLAAHDLQPIPTQGVPFDPERMEAVEVVAAEPGQPGEPVEELRRGWLWRGRVLRFAQVRLRK